MGSLCLRGRPGHPPQLMGAFSAVSRLIPSLMNLLNFGNLSGCCPNTLKSTICHMKYILCPKVMESAIQMPRVPFSFRCIRALSERSGFAAFSGQAGLQLLTPRQEGGAWMVKAGPTAVSQLLLRLPSQSCQPLTMRM